MIYEEYDPELDEAIQLATPEFGSSLKRRFTNVGVCQSIRNSKNGNTPTKLEDVFVRDGQNRIQLKSIEIIDPPVPRMNEIIPSLKERNLRISSDWYNIILKGTYQMFNTSQIKLFPVISTGHFLISIEDTKAQGLIGFTIAGEALQATNFDIEYNARNVTVQVEYFNNLKNTKECNIIKEEDIANTVAKHIRNELYVKLEDSLRKNLNKVLMDYSLLEIFNDSTEITNKYKNMARTTERATNTYVDKVIAEVNKRNRISFNLPNINESGFIAQDAKLANLQSMRRKITFSKITNKENGHITLFGEVELSKCMVSYGFWNYWILHGFINVDLPRNRIKIKLTTTSTNFFRREVRFKFADIRVFTLGKLEIDISGLGIFKWVADQIIALIHNAFEINVRHILSDKLHKRLQQFVENSLTFR